MTICEMLGQHNIRKVNGEIPINTIRILLKHVLNNSYFTLQLPGRPPKFFQQTRGGAMGSVCTQVLADVYIRKWEKSLIEQQEKENELYRRFRDDIFLTTQKTIEEMHNILNDLGKKDPNIQITYPSECTHQESTTCQHEYSYYSHEYSNNFMCMNTIRVLIRVLVLVFLDRLLDRQRREYSM
jgi:hypothetical protein